MFLMLWSNSKKNESTVVNTAFTITFVISLAIGCNELFAIKKETEKSIKKSIVTGIIKLTIHFHGSKSITLLVQYRIPILDRIMDIMHAMPILVKPIFIFIKIYAKRMDKE